jgi:hypothetical protein
MDLLTATVAERPDLARLLDDFNPWPRFMHQDPVGSLYYADPVGMYPEFVQVAIDRDHRGVSGLESRRAHGRPRPQPLAAIVSGY